ncbi:hypothetical protein [Scytonema sp. HK-05]|uniref:hypothetical protein n=1 Tax=Scytonema sp. HK-05 TaxID=1137095 RepID=UPI001161349E|nr:hypothetical protein [Scytonema sp. HK-05]
MSQRYAGGSPALTATGVRRSLRVSVRPWRAAGIGHRRAAGIPEGLSVSSLGETPHQLDQRALVVSHCGLGVSPSRASGVRRRRAEGIPGGRV